MAESTHKSAKEKVRTTIDLPLTVKERIERALDRGAAKSQNALIVYAVEQLLEDLERSWLDAQFAEIDDDDSYQALQLRIAKEFASQITLDL